MDFFGQCYTLIMTTIHRSPVIVSALGLLLLSGCSTALHRAASAGDAARVERELAAGAPVEGPAAWNDPDTPLIVAAGSGQVEVMEILLKNGADVNRQSNIGWSPIGLAARHCHLEAVKFLVSHGAEANLNFDRWSKSPILSLAAGNCPAAIPLLISAGADPVVGLEGCSSAWQPAYVARCQQALQRYQPRAQTIAAADPATTEPPSQRQKAVEVTEPAAPASDIDQPARTGASRPDDFALVIGIEDYQGLPKADFGARDARTARKHFEALGLPARNIISLEGPAATGNKIKSYLEEWLPLNVKEDSTLLIYFSGHGAPDPQTGQAYLVPWDGDPQFLKSTAYPLKKLYADLAKTKARHVIVALDACFSGAGGRSVLAKGARPLVTKFDQGVAPDGRITILAAASEDQITGTLDDQGHGMFTYFFLKGLGEGKKSAQTLFDYISPRVQDEARRQNRQQTPALIGPDAPL